MTIPDLDGKTLLELQKIAKEYNIKNISSYRKTELLALLKETIEKETAQKPPAPKKTKKASPRTESGRKKEALKKETARKKDEASAKRAASPKKEVLPKEEISVKETPETQSAAEAVPETTPVQTMRETEENTRRRDVPADSDPADGILEILPDGFGFLRCANQLTGTRDIYVSPSQIRRFNLKTGDHIVGRAKFHKDGEKFQALIFVETVNGDGVDKAIRRRPFETLIPIFPDTRIPLGTGQTDFSMRLVDLVAPIGFGQRGLIVAQPKAGKTTILKSIAKSISRNKDIKLIVLLIDERPEEVTDMQRSIDGEVVYSTFDELPEHHIKVAELVLERAQRLVEHGKDVVILLDSITRLSRAYNLTIPPTGKTLSGGLDPGALHKPKRFFGAARNIENGGSLTILATALIDTGSRMDDMIFEEFKGTGNMEIHLDRKLSEKRVFPAIDINKSGTRREELLLSTRELEAVWAIRKAYSNLPVQDVTENIIQRLISTKTNEDFIEMTIKASYTNE